MFPCHLCDRDYCWRSSLEKHLRAYYGEPQFSCPLCPRIFRHKASLEQHSFSKHNPGFQKFMCDLCGKNYLTKWGLTRHARIHSDPNNNSKSVLWKTCGKSYTRNDLLQAHERTHLPKTKRHACDKEVFHIKEHSKCCPSLKKKQHFMCNICTKKFKERRYLNEHKKSKHTPTEPYHCENCDASFNYRASLSNHRKICRKWQCLS